MFIAEPEWRDKYVKPQLEFIRNNFEDRNVRGKENMGFYQWEGDKFKRLYDIMNEEHLDEETLRKNRSDFVIFVDEHDRRRGTNFIKTFPEMEHAYCEWKQCLT